MHEHERSHGLEGCFFFRLGAAAGAAFAGLVEAVDLGREAFDEDERGFAVLA